MTMSTWARRLGWVLGTAVAVGTAACAPSPQQKLKNEFEAMRKESTPARLQAQGDAFAGVGDMTRAEQYYVAALRQGGDSGLITRKLLAVCVSDGRYPVAMAYADEYLRRHPSDTDVRFAQSTIFAAVGDTDKARDSLERVLVEAPAMADAHYALASLIRREGDNPLRADQHFREYLRLRPDGTYAEVARASLLKTVR